MVEEIKDIVSEAGETLNKSLYSINDLVPEPYKTYIILGIFIILISIYSIFVWKFYRFLAKRDLLELNLAQYNKYEYPFLKRFFAVLLFILEYLIILPVVVFFWFFVISIILAVLAKEHNISNILIISATLVGAIRITAYYSEDLSKDLAKLFPFTVLLVAILTPNFFDIDTLINKISEIPNLLNNILFYLIAIMILEFALRIFFLIMPELDEEES
ncbi:MAG: hypothetical protein QXX91_03350 [Thermoplasmata archaeon]